MLKPSRQSSKKLVQKSLLSNFSHNKKHPQSWVFLFDGIPFYRYPATGLVHLKGECKCRNKNRLITQLPPIWHMPPARRPVTLMIWSRRGSLLSKPFKHRQVRWWIRAWPGQRPRMLLLRSVSVGWDCWLYDLWYCQTLYGSGFLVECNPANKGVNRLCVWSRESKFRVDEFVLEGFFIYFGSTPETNDFVFIYFCTTTDTCCAH